MHTNQNTLSTTRQNWSGRQVWHGQLLDHSEQWVELLTAENLADIRASIEAAHSSGKCMEEMTASDFPFGSFGDRLSSIRDEVLNGRGFALIRGLSGDQWSDEQLMLAYWGIGRWLGDAVPQNAKAHLLGHVIDRRVSVSADTRIYQTNQAQPFHSDSCDVVGLLCVRPAKAGGQSAIASSAAIYNQLQQQVPELLSLLCGEFQCDRYGEIPAGKLPHYPVRVFNEVAGNLVCCGMDPDIRTAQRLESVERLTSAQFDALDRFQQTAEKLALNMMLQRGDIQLVNNLTVVHSRAAFEDHAEADRRRYLVRLWLSSPHGRELPAFLAERWGTIEPGRVRGGIVVPGATPAVQLNPDD